MLDDQKPVSFNLFIKNGKKIINPVKLKLPVSDWKDYKIDLSGFSGREVEISFECSSLDGNIVFYSSPVIHALPKKKINVVIILEDALRADHLSTYGYHKKTTPVKDRWAKKGVLFLNACSQATKTRPSIPSIMTSLYPTTTGVWNFFESLDERFLTLAEILQNQGFKTISVIQNPQAGSMAGLEQGYDQLIEQYQGKAADIYRELAGG